MEHVFSRRIPSRLAIVIMASGLMVGMVVGFLLFNPVLGGQGLEQNPPQEQVNWIFPPAVVKEDLGSLAVPPNGMAHPQGLPPRY